MSKKYIFDPDDVHINEALRGFSVAYRNSQVIWPDIMPIVRVDKRSDLYRVFDESTDFDATDDRISPNGQANEIRMAMSDDNYSVRSYALGAHIPYETLANADDPIRPILRAQTQIRRQLQTRHEKRVADIVFNQANYVTGYKEALSGGSRWDTATGTPIEDITDALDSMLMRANTLVLSLRTWRGISRNPSVRAAIYPSGSNAITGGVVTSSAFLNLLQDEGITRILIGQHRLNTARPEQAPVISRIWGPHASLLYIDENPGEDTATWGVTFSESQTNPVRVFKPERGEKGSEYLKDSWNADSRVIADKAGYFFQNAVS